MTLLHTLQELEESRSILGALELVQCVQNRTIHCASSYVMTIEFKAACSIDDSEELR